MQHIIKHFNYGVCVSSTKALSTVCMQLTKAWVAETSYNGVAIEPATHLLSACCQAKPSRCGRYELAFVPLTSRRWCVCAKCPCPCPPSQVGPWAAPGRFRLALWRARNETAVSCRTAAYTPHHICFRHDRSYENTYILYYDISLAR